MAEWVWPNGKKTPPPVNSPYGIRIHPVTGKRTMHYGTDFHIPDGINRSITDGTVQRVGRVVGWSGGGYGIWVKNSDGSLAKYFHGVEGSAYVKVGQKVKAGDKLSRTGMTGTATGVHLHLEISPAPGGANSQTDPVPFLRNKVVESAGTGGGTTIPETPNEEEEDDMPRNTGIYYKTKDKKTYVYMTFNAGSGFYTEFSAGSGAGAMPSAYNNALAVAMDTPSWAEVTESHYNGIKASLNKIVT